MADIISKEQRSSNMAAIKSKNTKPEVFLRKMLHHIGYRYSLHPVNVPGKPDIYLKKYNTVIFVNGCFWHRHKNCKYAYIPKSNRDFWQLKFENNKKRDQIVKTQIINSHLKMLVVWECTLKRVMKNPDDKGKLLVEIVSFLNSDMDYLEL